MARNRDWEAKGIAIGNVDSGKLAANKNAQVEGDGERGTKMRGAVILRFLRPFWIAPQSRLDFTDQSV